MLLTDSRDKTVLIVVNNPDFHSRLAEIIRSEGFKAVVASDGMQGMVKYYQQTPDLVLLDYKLQGMGVLDVCRQLKALSSDRLVPIIIISGYLNDESITKCIQAGADDIVFKPFSMTIFRARIYAMFRIGDLYHKLCTLKNQQQSDEELAEQLFSEVVEKGNVAEDQIKIFKRSAETFSGDVQLTALCPNGDINVMLGDFTGHGLSSAIGAIPLSDTFRAMTDKGYGTLDIIKQVNRKMHRLLPTHMFLAISMVSFSIAEQLAHIWNAGMEDIFVFDAQTGELKHRIPSFHPPLGIAVNLLFEKKPETIPLGTHDRIIMYSDGIVEARNRAGEFFGEQRLLDATRQGFADNDVQGHIIAALEVFCEDLPQDDDISLVDINCDISLYNEFLVPTQVDKSHLQDDILTNQMLNGISGSDEQWDWQFSLVGHKLASVNPIPLIMNQLHEIEAPGDHWHSLYTVLTELYVNALDHGVLKLSSEIKSSPQGFAQYFEEKEQRLEHLTNSCFVKIRLHHEKIENGGILSISILDSGSGFEFSPWIEIPDDDSVENTLPTNQFSGRGIKLVRQICQDLVYLENGSLVKATFIWSN